MNLPIFGIPAFGIPYFGIPGFGNICLGESPSVGFRYLRNPCFRNPCFRNPWLRNFWFRNPHLRNFSRIQAPLNQTPLRLPASLGPSRRSSPWVHGNPKYQPFLGPPLFYKAPPRQFQPPKCKSAPSKKGLATSNLQSFCIELHSNHPSPIYILEGVNLRELTLMTSWKARNPRNN